MGRIHIKNMHIQDMVGVVTFHIGTGIYSFCARPSLRIVVGIFEKEILFVEYRLKFVRRKFLDFIMIANSCYSFKCKTYLFFKMFNQL